MSDINVGDWVRAKADAEDQFTKGNVYEVRCVNNESIGVVKDDSGIENGWDRKFFELVRRSGEFKVGDIVSWANSDPWQNIEVNKVEGSKVYATTNTGVEGLFFTDEHFYKLTLVKPVYEGSYATVNIYYDGKVEFKEDEEFKNHELTVNEARAIADKACDSMHSVINIYESMIELGFKITKD